MNLSIYFIPHPSSFLWGEQMRKLYFIIALTVVVTLPLDVVAQRRRGRGVQSSTRGSATKASTHIEPVRALSGRMFGNRITAQLSNNRPGFDYIVTGASVVDGKLQLQGTLRPVASTGAGTEVRATLIGTLARSANPWPNAASAPVRRAAASGQTTTQPQGREARNPETAGELGQLSQATQDTARTTQTPTAPRGQRPPAGEVTEQTQSLYAATDVGSGCEIMYFKMELPQQLAASAHASQPVQLGVVLAPIDNRRGEQINQSLCRVVRALGSGQDIKGAQNQLAELNRLLAAGGQ